MNIIMIIFILVVISLCCTGSQRSAGIRVNPFCMKANCNGKCTEKKVKRFFGIRKYCVDFYGLSEYCEFRDKPQRPDPPPAFRVSGNRPYNV